MTIARTDGGIEIEWTSGSVPVEQLDAALNRGVYELMEANEQDVFSTAHCLQPTLVGRYRYCSELKTSFIWTVRPLPAPLAMSKLVISTRLGPQWNLR
jgi:hypothetical protein